MMKKLATELLIRIRMYPDTTQDAVKALELAQALCSAIDQTRRVIRQHGDKR